MAGEGTRYNSGVVPIHQRIEITPTFQTEPNQPRFAWFETKAVQRPEIFREWESESEGLIKSFIGKIAGMTVRLSLVLSYLEWASEPYDKEPHEIGATHFSRAVLFVEANLLPMARRTYADASVPASERSARRLLALILSEGWHQFTTRQVLRMERAGLNRSYVLEPAINALMEADIIRQITSPPGPKGGRPFRTFAVNPAIHGMHR